MICAVANFLCGQASPPRNILAGLTLRRGGCENRLREPAQSPLRVSKPGEKQGEQILLIGQSRTSAGENLSPPNRVGFLKAYREVLSKSPLGKALLRGSKKAAIGRPPEAMD